MSCIKSIPCYYSKRIFIIGIMLNIFLLFPLGSIIAVKNSPSMFRQLNIEFIQQEKDSVKQEQSKVLVKLELSGKDTIISRDDFFNLNEQLDSSLESSIEHKFTSSKSVEDRYTPTLFFLIIVCFFIFLWFNYPIKRYFRKLRKGQPTGDNTRIKKILLRTPFVNSVLFIIPFVVSSFYMLENIISNEHLEHLEKMLYFDYLIVSILSFILSSLFVFSWQRSRISNYYIHHVFTKEELRSNLYWKNKRGKISNRFARAMISSTILPLLIVFVYVFISATHVSGELIMAMSDVQKQMLMGELYVYIPDAFYTKILSKSGLFYVTSPDLLMMNIGLFSGLIIALVYSKMFITWMKDDVLIPVNEMLSNMNDISSGNLDAYTVVRTNDEIGLLSKGYNDMVTKIQTYVGEISEMNAELEKKVLERTSEIEQQKQEITTQRDTLSELNEELEQQKQEIQATLENLKQAQSKLVESEKMASLGALVAGVAHEINTPVGIGVQGVSGMVNRTNKLGELLTLNTMKKSDLEQYLEFMKESGSLVLSNLLRTGELIKGFKQVSVDHSTEGPRIFNLKQYFNDVINSLYPKYKHLNVSLHIDCANNIELYSHPGAFAQIITNFVINSLNHAFDPSLEGIIKLSAKTEKDKLIILYSDNGKGMDEDVKSKIFEPFFTTNKQIGTGLGMHIVYNLVTQKLNGEISCQSSPGKGVLFTIILPYSKNKL